MPVSRRAFLVGAATIPAVARAFLDASRFIPAVARHGGRWNARVSGLRRMCWELQHRTSVEAALEARSLDLASSALFSLPFLYFGSDRAIPPLSAPEVENLRRYLTFGGFVFAEANDDGEDAAGFDASFRREIARVLPQAPLAPLPTTHVVFRSFFLLDAPAGRLLRKPTLDAMLLNKRAAVIYSQNDVVGALNRDEGGGWEFDPTPGGERQRELAIRTAINVVMYAMCLDYKDDAVHLPLILDRRK